MDTFSTSQLQQICDDLAGPGWSLQVVHTPGHLGGHLCLLWGDTLFSGDTAMGFARDAGYGQMRLWTHESHVAAGRLYARAGFDLVSSTPAQAFGQAVIDQIWQCKL